MGAHRRRRARPRPAARQLRPRRPDGRVVLARACPLDGRAGAAGAAGAFGRALHASTGWATWLLTASVATPLLGRLDVATLATGVCLFTAPVSVLAFAQAGRELGRRLVHYGFAASVAMTGIYLVPMSLALLVLVAPLSRRGGLALSETVGTAVSRR